jgi:hypothetical protein
VTYSSRANALQRPSKPARLALLGFAAVVALTLIGCSGRSAQSRESEAPDVSPTATAVAGIVTSSFNARCLAVGRGAELRVDYRAIASLEKRLVRVTLTVNDEVLFDSGDIDQQQLSGAKTLSLEPGSSNVVIFKAMPQDGRFASGRKEVKCPGAKPGFRARAGLSLQSL